MMAAIEANGTFNPLTTPYEVDQTQFPREGTLREQFVHLVRYAILAPSSHNTQPWKFRLFDNGIAVYADYARRLPIADPNNRELLMGVGAAVLNLRVAAAHFGFECYVNYNFSGDSELPVAFVQLSRALPQKSSDKVLDMLFSSIAKRHTNRHPFLMARVPESLLTRLINLTDGSDVLMHLSTNPQRNTQVAHLVAEAERAQHADAEFRKELGAWMRPNKTQKPDGMTGAAFGFNDVTSTVTPWAVRAIDMGSARARHDERLCIEAPALCVLYGEDVVPTWLATGELLQRVLLMLTRDGLQVSYFNMPIEIPEARKHLREILELKAMPQLLLRIGYSLEKPSPTPRRAVEDCIEEL